MLNSMNTYCITVSFKHTGCDIHVYSMEGTNTRKNVTMQTVYLESYIWKSYLIMGHSPPCLEIERSTSFYEKHNILINTMHYQRVSLCTTHTLMDCIIYSSNIIRILYRL